MILYRRREGGFGAASAEVEYTRNLRYSRNCDRAVYVESVMDHQSADKSRTIVEVVFAALSSMAAVDGPLGVDTLLADITIDSLDLVELTQILEDECELIVAHDAFTDVASVGDVLAAVRRSLP